MVQLIKINAAALILHSITCGDTSSFKFNSLQFNYNSLQYISLQYISIF